MSIKFVSLPVTNPAISIMAQAHVFQAKYILKSLIEMQKYACDHWYACPKIVTDASAYFSALGFGQGHYEEIELAIPEMIRALHGCKIRFTRIMQFLARVHCQMANPCSTENLPHAIDLGLQCNFLSKAEHSDLRRRISSIDYSFKENGGTQHPTLPIVPSFQVLAGFFDCMGLNSKIKLLPPHLHELLEAAFRIFQRTGSGYTLSTLIQTRQYAEMYKNILALQDPYFDQFFNVLHGPMREGGRYCQQPWAAIFALICYSHSNGKLSEEVCKFILEIAKKDKLVTPDELERLQQIAGTDKIVTESVQKPKTLRLARTLRAIRCGINNNARTRERKAQIQFYVNLFFGQIVPARLPYYESQTFARLITHGSNLGEMSPLMKAAHELLVFSGILYEVDQFVRTNNILDVDILTELFGMITSLVTERITIPNQLDVDENNVICFFALILAYRHLELEKINKESLTLMLGIADDLCIFDATTVSNLREMIND